MYLQIKRRNLFHRQARIDCLDNFMINILYYDHNNLQEFWIHLHKQNYIKRIILKNNKVNNYQFVMCCYYKIYYFHYNRHWFCKSTRNPQLLYIYFFCSIWNCIHSLHHNIHSLASDLPCNNFHLDIIHTRNSINPNDSHSSSCSLQLTIIRFLESCFSNL